MDNNKKTLPIPENEETRLKILHEYNLLDSLPEEQLDNITRLAAVICEVPIALVSLIDKDRQWFKSNIGLDAEETPRDISFCQYAIMNDAFFEVENALNDDRFKANPLVLGYPNIRSYASFPLFVKAGYAIGTLCMISDKPKKLRADQKEALKILADQVVNFIKLQKESAEKEQFVKFFDLTYELLCLAGTDGYFKEVSPSFTRKLGFSTEELLSRPFFDFIHPDDFEKTATEVAKLSVGVPTVSFINRYRTKENTYLWLDWNATPDPETGMLYAVARDITAQHRAEELLIESEERYRIFFENVQGILLTHSLDGEILSINSSISEIIGFEKELLIGKNLLEISPEENKEKVRAYLKQISTNRTSNGIYQARHRDGSMRLIYFRNIVISPKRGEDYVMGNGIDITDRVEMEQELKRAVEEAAKSAKVKDEFLSNMSHEIRTPMNAVMGFTEILKESDLSAQQLEFVNAISKAGEHLLVIINDILDSSKMESGKLALEHIPFDLPAAILDAKRLMKDKADDKNLGFNFYLESEIPRFIMGDPVRFNQILVNLIGNALKFTEKGKVEVFCSLLEQTDQDCLIEIKVKDTGIGIPEDKQAFIFDRFHQADESTNRKFGGTGLGLNISKVLVEMQGGSLTFNSVENEGSEFIATIRFDLDHNPEAVIEQMKPKDDFTGVNVLLVEDNELNQILATQHLEKMKVAIDIADNGDVAIQKLKQKSYDVILMDLQMPVMDGYVATQIIREGMGIKTPIIAMTAHSLVGESAKCFAIGMNEYISKPYKREELIRKMRIVLDLVEDKQIQIASEVVSSINNPTSYDFDTFLAFTGGSSEFGKKLASTYLKTVPAKIEELSNAFAAKDGEKVKQAAHYLKPSLEMFSAMDAVEACAYMEKNSLDEKNRPLIEKLIQLNTELSNLLRKHYEI